MLFLIVVVLVGALSAPCFAIDSNKLPFGSQVLRTYSTEEVRKLSDEMYFNYFIEYDTIGSTAIGMLYDEGIQTIKGGVIDWNNAEPPMKYSWSNYGVIDVDYPYPNGEVRMEKFGGSFTNGSWVSAEGAIDTLSGISTYQGHFSNAPEKRNRVAFFDQYFFNFFGISKIPYRIDLFAAIDSPDSTSDEIVATVIALAGMWNTCEMKPINVDTILVRNFGNSSSLQWIQGVDFTIPDSFTVIDMDSTGCNDTTFYTNLNNGTNRRWYPYLRLDIITTGTRQFKIDSIKVSDDIGRQLIAENAFDGVITAQFQQYSGQPDSIYAWMLMDEPLFTNIMPFDHIDSLMHEVYDGWLTFTNFWQYSGGARLIHTYLSMVDVNYVAADIYPFGTSDVYAGDSFQDFDNGKYGPLWRFPQHVSWVREAVDYIDKEFWITVQGFEGDQENPPTWRYPTASELSVQVFIALAWGCQGIQVWLYDHWDPDIKAIRHDGNETPLYTEIKDHIGPYLQAVDSTYLALNWDTAYAINYTNGFGTDGTWIDTIYAISNSPDSNPDLGWFHVGQFTEGGDKYVMLVNRACSQGPNNPAPAPSITATVRFDAASLGLGNYVEIIDIADSVDYISYDSILVFADTTLVSSLGGVITYSTILGPGEGRLFKLASAR